MPHYAELCHSRKVSALIQSEKPVALNFLLFHWLIVAGAFLAMFGFVGLAFQRNRHGDAHQKNIGRDVGTKGN